MVLNVQRWADIQMLMMKSEVVGQPSVVSDDLVQSVDKTICERHHFSISGLLRQFPQISHIVLYEIITVRLGYHKFGVRWVLKMLTGA
jgi:hypothetical protein